MTKTYFMTRYVKISLLTKHSFADTGPTAGTSKVGSFLGMRYGQEHSFARKESLCTCTISSKRAYPTEFPLWTHRPKITEFPLFMSLDPVWLYGVVANFRKSEYKTVLLPHRKPSCSKYILEVRTVCCQTDLMS